MMILIFILLNSGDHKDYKTQLAETSRRENVLVMRLATKEQELQDYAVSLTYRMYHQFFVPTFF